MREEREGRIVADEKVMQVRKHRRCSNLDRYEQLFQAE